ncbi:lipopolysaccharide heptosyltransferase I [Methylobacter sp.]|uniref:lipopolysaccharide heptosyltransferase I n=1 Tax=Methylobacter sp. TaxID=2051955 RepID=UPI0024896DBD|nr:lipopolysaccharide heptosyltransferase I [Methylobacter sp.]MDI1276696.1 lipopolysaccharide heptosyltransferase I [Methylobacter sp.]MDI1357365.1 lipopolysaccharide heptosyltransferase I [Methylobacter sp.]
MKIAIVKLSALGDIVHAMVALQFIKAHSPEIRIDWIVEERFAEVLKHNPDIDNILTVNLKALKTNKAGIFAQLKKIRSYASNNYDLVIDAQGLIKSAITAKLISPWKVLPSVGATGRSPCGAHIAGFDADSIREKAASWFYGIKVACAYDANTIDRNALILSSPLGIDITKEQILNKKPFLFFNNEDPQIYDFLSKDRLNIVLVIGSTWDSRNYPAAKFVKIAEALQQNCLVVWGSEQEKATAEWMATQSDLIKVMPKLDLNSLKALIAKADLLIGNDTGPTHVAWGLNRPSITIFGPTPVSRVYQTDINKVVKSASIVNPYKLDKQDYSIKDIDEQEIIKQAKFLLTL